MRHRLLVSDSPSRRSPARGLLIAGVLAALVLGMAPSAFAQLEDNLSSYRDETAAGYLKPLAEAFGQNLNTGFFTSAAIPVAGFRARLEVQAMSVFFGSGDETFRATTGGDFLPETTVDAPTVVGPGESVSVVGTGGTVFVFPGGFDLSSFTLAVPQLTVGSFMGTEATVRWIAVDTGDADIGDIGLLGFGVRHNISQYMAAAPVDLAANVFYQKLTVGDNDLLDAKTFSFGLQASRGMGVLEPFASLTLDSYKLTADYTVNEGEPNEENLSVEVKSSMKPHALVGLGAHLGIVHLHVAGNLSSRPGVSAGLALGL